MIDVTEYGSPARKAGAWCNTPDRAGETSMSTNASAALESAATTDRIDPVDELDYSQETGRRAVYEAFAFERAGDMVRVWNESHAQSEDHVYTVELDDADVPERCTCPAFEYHCGPGEVCKHALAVALHLPEIEDLASEGR